MDTEKVIEQIFIPENNLIALITDKYIRIQLWNKVYMNKDQADDYMKKNMPGWIQTHEGNKRPDSHQNHDRYQFYLDLFSKLEEKYPDLVAG